ncbi:aldehyde dehydrogenase [Streptomyces sp. NPDC057486]|uniref:aldehyde dehydrogenase n=1 Tax=Streptomyces sp. NPDC057486 TaxID=3346145 RepID=UPI0036836FDB
MTAVLQQPSGDTQKPSEPEAERATWLARAATLPLPTNAIVDGAELSAGGGSLPVIGPRDGNELTRVFAGDDAAVDHAVRAARVAFDSGPWPRMSPRERAAVLLRLADLAEQHRDELALLITLEMGKPITHSRDIEMRAVVNCLRWYAEVADKGHGEVRDTDPQALALVTREPVGVVGIVTPWNFPLTLTMWKLAPALIAGCTTVVKPAEQSPLSILRLAQLAIEAGLPPGVLNVVPGTGPVAGQALGLHAGVDALAFTGSTATGRAFARYGADSNLKRVWLELGGKSPNIILPDAPDLQRAVDTAVWAFTFNSGQMCTCGSRLIVHRDLADEVVENVVRGARAVPVGDPLDPAVEMGPIATAAQLASVRGYIDRAVAAGARLLTGGSHAPDRAGLPAGGNWLEPTILTDVAPDSELARTEVFGPVLAMTVVDSTDEAVEIANDCEYGLAAAVWTSDLSTAHTVSRRLRAGTVWVNCYEEGDMGVPFGGFGLSGNGRDKSAHALDKYTELKTTWMQL